MLKNILKLSLGASAAQALVFFASPFISRIYSPSEFGIYGNIMVIIGLLSMISCFSFDMAIVKEKNKILKDHLCNLSLLITSSVSIISTIFMCAYVFILDKNAVYIMVGFTVFFYGILNIIYAVLNSEKNYNLLAKVQFIRGFLTVLLQILIGYFLTSSYGLVYGVLISSLFVILYCLINYPSIIKQKINKNLTKIVFFKHIDFFRYTTLQNIISYSSANMVVIFLGYYYGYHEVGAYYLCFKLLQAPANLIGQSIKRVFYQFSCDNFKSYKKMLTMYQKMVIMTLILPISVVIIITYTDIESIFIFIFGNEWILSSKYSAWMAIWFSMNFVLSPTRVLFATYSYQKELLIFDVVTSLIKLVSIVYLCEMYSSIIMIKYYSLLCSGIAIIPVLYWWVKLKYLARYDAI